MTDNDTFGHNHKILRYKKKFYINFLLPHQFQVEVENNKSTWPNKVGNM